MIAIDAVVDVLALLLLGVRAVVGAVDGLVPPKPVPPPVAIEIEMTIEPPQPALPREANPSLR